jgi:hypothetical protein
MVEVGRIRHSVCDYFRTEPTQCIMHVHCAVQEREPQTDAECMNVQFR